MRVGVNTLFLIPGEVGGSETYLVESLRALAQCDPALTLVLFTQHENDAYWRERLGCFPNVERVPLRFRAAHRAVRILCEQIQLPAAARRARVEVLWSPGYTAPFWARCPQVVSILDMQYRRHPEDLAWLARLVTHGLIVAGSRRCRRVLTLSEFSRREIMRHTGLASEKITVTPLAAAPDFFAKPPEAVRAAVRRRLGVTGPYLLCVANTYPHKNVPRLVAAFGLLAAEFPHQLVLVGQPRRGEAAVQAALVGLAARDRVHRLERVTRDDLVVLYQDAALFVFPSLYEGFGLPVLESMAAGTPVVAWRQAAIPEVGGDAIAYAERDDAAAWAAQMRALLRLDAGARAAWSARAQARARSFSWDRTAAAIAGALRGA
ncbi:MAG: glycosyltransferase family 1 protein [Kiritimatiellaeota bacterium]|nr:glycosyltransferase family 1 protein [Kiritimatiellota bacterium]